jgi:hypothetical protein
MLLAMGGFKVDGEGERDGFKEWADGWAEGWEEGKTKGFIKPLALGFKMVITF